MLTHLLKHTTGCLYHYRVVENYDAWKAIGHAFSKYDVARMSTDFYMMYETATDHLQTYLPECVIARLTRTYEQLFITIEALHFMARDKGIDVSEPPPEAGFYPAWAHERVTPADIIQYCCTQSEPHVTRNDLWMLFEGAFGCEWSTLSKQRRKRMMTLYERLTELATAAYMIAVQMTLSKKPHLKV